MEKYCKGCRQWHDRSNFNRRQASRDGLQRVCKGCAREADRKSYHAHRVHCREFLDEQECARCFDVKPIGRFRYDYRYSRRDLVCLDCRALDRARIGPVSRPLSHEALDRRIRIAHRLKALCGGDVIPRTLLNSLLPM